MRFMLVVASLGFLAACGGQHAPRTEEPAASVTVRVRDVSPAEWESVYEATGSVQARTASVISSKVMGYVSQVGFRAGDRVRSGQVLVELDSRDLDAQVRQAQAARQEAEDASREAEAGVASARTSLELAQVTFRRMQDLFQKKSISNQEFDEASARLKVTQSAHEMAVARRRQVAAKVGQAEAAVQAATVMRGFARITAPFDGVVTDKRVEPGNLAAPGGPLATVEREGSYRLEASVEESRLSSIRPGQTVSVVLESLGREIGARVDEVVPAVDPASRSYTVKIELPALAGLRSGMFGRARFAAGRRNVLAVPAGAVREQGQLRSVFVAEGGVARTRLVSLGEPRGGEVEVLSGLTAGEKIVFPLPSNLADGARLEVQP